MKDVKKILFIGHDASRTGAPLLLLEFLRWLQKNSNFNVELLLKNGGNLEEEYKAIAPVYNCQDLLPKIDYSLHRRILRKIKLERIPRVDLNNMFPIGEYPLVYANTIATLNLAKELCRDGRQGILHLHELEYAVEVFGDGRTLRESSQFISSYVAASQAVKRFMVEKMGLPSGRISVIHEFPVAYLEQEELRVEFRRKVRESFGVDDNTSVIGMCGTLDWRKGADLFIQLALRLKSQYRKNFLCVWIGGNPNDSHVRHDVERSGLGDVVRIESASSNPEQFFPAFDVFALTSREDPFPVAMLEAAASGVPIIAFRGAGGAEEFVENDAGAIVPYLDVSAMADAGIQLLADESRRKKLGQNAMAKVKSHYLLSAQGPKYLSLITETMRNAPGAGSGKGLS